MPHPTKAWSRNFKNIPSPYFPPLTTKHPHRFKLTFENIIDLLIVLKNVAKKLRQFQTIIDAD
jgi:hypothetical protein